MLAMGELLHARQLATKLDGVDGEFQVEEKAWCDRVDRQTIVFGLACFYLARACMQGAYPCTGGLDYSRFVGGILSRLPLRLDSRSRHRKQPVDPVGFVLMRQQLGIVLLWWVEGYANLHSRASRMISHEEGRRSTRASAADTLQGQYFSHMLGLLPARLFTDPSLYRHPMTHIYQLDVMKLFQDRESDNVVVEDASSLATSSSSVTEASRDKCPAALQQAIAFAIFPETLGNSGTLGAAGSQTQMHSLGSRRSKQRRATDKTRRACNAAARGLHGAVCSGEFFNEFAEMIVPLCHIVANIPPPVSASSSSSAAAAGFPLQERLFDELLKICIVHSVVDSHGNNVWMQLFRSAAATGGRLHPHASSNKKGTGMLRLPSAAILQQLKALGWDENPAFAKKSAMTLYHFHGVIGKFLSEAQREGARGLSLQAQMKEQVRRGFSGSSIAFGILLEVACAIFKHEMPEQQGRRARHLWRTTNPCRMQSALLGFRQLGWDRSALLQSINLERDTIVASLFDAIGSNVLGVVPTAYKEKALRASLAKVAHFVLDRRQASVDLGSPSLTQTQTQSQSQTANNSGVGNFEALSGKQGVSTRRLLLGVGHFRILMTFEQCLLQSPLVAQWGYLKVLSWLLVGGGYYPEPDKRQKWSLLNLDEPLIFSKVASILCRVLLSVVGKVQPANIVADGEQLDECMAGIEAALFCVEVLNNRIGGTKCEGISIDPDGARHNEFAGRHAPDILRIALVLLWAVAAIRNQFQPVAHLTQQNPAVADKIQLLDAKILSTLSKILENRGLPAVKVSIEVVSGANPDEANKTRFHREVLYCPPADDSSKAGCLLWFLPVLAFNSLVIATAAAFEGARLVSIELARDAAALPSSFISAQSRTADARAATVNARKRYSLAVFSFVSCAHVVLNVDQCFGDVGVACATQLCKTFSRAQCARSIVKLQGHLWLVDETRLLAKKWHETTAGSPGSSFHDFLHFLHATQSAEIELVIHCRDLLASLLHSCRGIKPSDVLGRCAHGIPHEVMRYICDSLRHFWSLRETQSSTQAAAAAHRRCGLQRRAFDDDAITAHQDRKDQGHGKGGAAFDDDYPLEVMTLVNNLMLCPDIPVARAATKMVASCVSDPGVFSALKERLRQEVETTQMLLCVCLRQGEKHQMPRPGPVNWFDAQFYESRLVRLLVALHTFSYVTFCSSTFCLSDRKLHHVFA